jgi:hypothetical protein
MPNQWRTSSFISLLVAFGVFFVFSNTSLAYQQPPATHAVTPNTRTPAATQAAKAAKETYSVVLVGDEIRVVSTTEKLNLTKKLKDDYKQDLKKYTEAKKDKKNPDASSLKKPEEKDYAVKTLSKSPYKSQEDAQKFADEEIQKRSKGGKKTASNKNNNW